MSDDAMTVFDPNYYERRRAAAKPTEAELQAAAIERAGKDIAKGLKAVAAAIDRLADKLPAPED
jgi:uncharacterized membrane protein YqiK